MTTQSAVLCAFTFATAVARAGQVRHAEPLGDHAVEADRVEPVEPARRRPPGRGSPARSGSPSRASPARRRRFSSGSSWTGLPFQSRTSKATNCAGISADSFRIAALGRVEPHLHRVEVETAVALDHDLAVERGVGREEVAERAQLGEVAEQRPLVPAPERELAAVVLEHAAEAVPLRLVLPAVALGQLADELCLHRRERHVLSRHVREASRLGLRAMRRVAVTGLGAVTPLGNDARSTWDAAVAGKSGIDFIPTFDTSGFPVRIAAEVKGFDPAAVVGPEGGAPARPQRRASAWPRPEAAEDAGAGRRVRAGAGRRALRHRDRRADRDHAEQHAIARRARARPRLAVLHPERARRRRQRPDRDRARLARPELRAGLGVRHRLDRDRRGGGGDPPRCGGRGARRRRRGVPPPADPRRLLRDARARRRGGVPAARVAAVRR